VLVFHGFGAMRIAKLAVHPDLAWLKWLADFGWFGVHLFFVISGYCIAANVYRLAQVKLGAWNFLQDRLLRIYPTYWVACLLSILANVLVAPFNHVPLRANLPAGPGAALANAFLVEPYAGVPSLLLVSWSLVFELGFYFMVAAGFALWRRGVNHWLLLGLGLAGAVAGLFGLHRGIFYVFSLWPEFFCGCLVFFALWLKNSTPAKVWWPLLTVAGLTVIGWFTMPAGENTGQAIGAGAFAFLLYFLHPLDARIAGWRPLHWLAWVGTISYSLYLTHVTFIGKWINLASRRIASDSLLQLPLQMVGWAAAIMGAWLVFKFCEQPLERWRHAIRRRSRAATTTKAATK